MQIAVYLIVIASLAVFALVFLLMRALRESARLRARLEVDSKELLSLQRSFSRFAPEQIVERVIAGGVSKSAERREVTVLFADIVGFTEISERVEPDDLVRILNGYLTRTGRAVSEHRGHVAKFIGDGVLALFGALEHNPWQAGDAVEAALAIRNTIDDYNKELASAGLPSLTVSVGIHRGEVVSGIIGSQDLMEFTVIGRTVNIAARVEGCTRGREADVVVTQAVVDAIGDRFTVKPLGAVDLRGVSDAVEIYSVSSL